VAGPAASLEPEKKANSCWCLTGGRGGWVGGGIAGRYDHAASIRDLGGDLGRDCLGCAAISRDCLGARSGERQNRTVCTPTHRAYRVVEISFSLLIIFIPNHEFVFHYIDFGS
jgi:hypothetical protein